MPYRRLRVLPLLAAALTLILGPTPGARAINRLSAPVSAVARPAPVAEVDPGAIPYPPGAVTPPTSAPTAGTSVAGGTGAARPSGSPSPSGSRGGQPPDRSVGPGGSAKRTGSAAVALTFDDGPDPVQTPALLDLLRRHGVKATFCLVGFRARDNPDLVRRIAAEGHALCNHSWQHLVDLAQRPVDEIRHDLEATNDAIRAAMPGAKIRYFRAPGGHFTPDLVAIARGYGMASIYWQVDPRDWDHRGTASDQEHIARVIEAVRHEVRPGAIVLSHDNRQPTTIEAYRTLLPWLKARFTLRALPT
jgi:peptidoglycan/xylan/chitin deacetylase (PgdA/CDA1 family)